MFWCVKTLWRARGGSNKGTNGGLVLPGMRSWRVPYAHACLPNRHASCGLKVLQKPASASLFQMHTIVKCGVYILQNMYCPSSHSSENQGCWAVNLPLNADFQVSSIVHVRAFRRYLVPLYLSSWFSTRVFFDAKNLLLAPKMPFFNGSFALSGHVFHGSERFCLYHFNVFLYFSSRI